MQSFFEANQQFFTSCCNSLLSLFSDMIKIMSWLNSRIKNKFWRHASSMKYFTKNCSLCSDDKNWQDFWRQVLTCIVYYGGKWQDCFKTSLLKGRKFWFQIYKVPISKIEHSDLKAQISNMRNRKFQFGKTKRKIPSIEFEIENWELNKLWYKRQICVTIIYIIGGSPCLVSSPESIRRVGRFRFVIKTVTIY